MTNYCKEEKDYKIQASTLKQLIKYFDVLTISKREREVLQLIAYEYTMQEIATSLCVSHHTIISHRKNIMSKLNARNTAGLIRRAFEIGALTIKPQQHFHTNIVTGITMAW